MPVEVIEEELTLRRSKGKVRLPSEVRVGEDGQEVELRGILEVISNRFYVGGWGYGTLATDRGNIKITGTLEGHVVGTSIVVRGAFKDTPYGNQLDCSSIIVDSVSGDMTVIAAWARKNCKEHLADIVRVTKYQGHNERWTFLCDPEMLVAAGIGDEEARSIAGAARSYLKLIETKKGLMEKGFTDREATVLCKAHGELVLEIFEADPYGIVIDRILAFSRIDVVVNGRFPRNDKRRLHAALVQALVAAARNGHTAMPPKGAMKEAAEIAGVYVDALQGAGLPKQIVIYGANLQLKTTAWAEQDIATWAIEAMKRMT